jgi:hypothetical protein
VRPEWHGPVRKFAARAGVALALAVALATQGCGSYMDYCATNAACYRSFWETVLPGSCPGDCRPPTSTPPASGPAVEPTCIAGYELIHTGVVRCEPVKVSR